jgi:hypothetical protein
MPTPTAGEAKESTTPKASLGRIVMYNHNGHILPAIINGIGTGEGVHLCVFGLDGAFPATSVIRGNMQGQWNWPPRV